MDDSISSIARLYLDREPIAAFLSNVLPRIGASDGNIGEWTEPMMNELSDATALEWEFEPVEIKTVSTAVMDSALFKQIMADISRASPEEIAEAVEHVQRTAPAYFPPMSAMVVTLAPHMIVLPHGVKVRTSDTRSRDARRRARLTPR
jgi:hypothetical protein